MIKNLLRFIKNIFVYKEFLWKANNWDSEYSYLVAMKLVLNQRLIMLEQGTGFSVVGSNDIKDLKIAIEYINRITEGKSPLDNYDIVDNWDKWIIEGFGTKDVWIKKSSVVPNMNSRKYVFVIDTVEKMYRDNLYKLLRSKANSWWD